ncbi:MAG: peptidyl-prolyl cis-trans isomerase [Flavobacteriaceae bacterium]|nr:peptidyl-prolyl cis-trans isomerase [Flavobacteriaceae bacterium]NNK61486.1 peptidyl-prolyl cis-trans isomerase [Flavobacteriaceae bacterium]
MRLIGFLIVIFCFSSCEFFAKEEPGIPVARVNGSYLYQHDIENVIPEGTTPEDSLIQLNNYINKWATQQLLINGAKLNLSETKQLEFDQLVKQYASDLYTKAYLEALVKQNIDTTVSIDEAQSVYERNLESFKLNEELIKFRYINVDEMNSDVKDIEKRLKRFDDADKRLLDSISIQFRSYSLNDSIWIKANQALEKIPVLNAENRNELLKKSNFIQLKDSLGLYLMQIEDVLTRNELAPLEYVMPTIKQIVINKRKLEFIKQLEKDITKDAIKNGKFEIYK